MAVSGWVALGVRMRWASVSAVDDVDVVFVGGAAPSRCRAAGGSGCSEPTTWQVPVVVLLPMVMPWEESMVEA